MSKTLTAISIMGRIFLEGKARKVLIVAPTSVVPVWPKEMEEYADFNYEVKVLCGSSKNKVEELISFRNDGALQIAVINYESTWRILEQLLNWNADIIIADESQRIKSYAAKQSKALHKLGDMAKYKLILSGTPVQNAPLDLWSQYRFLDKRIFGTSYYYKYFYRKRNSNKKNTRKSEVEKKANYDGCLSYDDSIFNIYTNFSIFCFIYQ